jgi:hypothetical protein
MPMDFPDMDSLKRCAECHEFRPPNKDETEEHYRLELANHVQSRDFVESLEIRNKVGWDRFSPDQITNALHRRGLEV